MRLPASTLILVFACALASCSEAPAPAPSHPADPVVEGAVSAAPSAEAVIPVTAADARKLFKDFQASLKKETRGLDLANIEEYRAFKSAQSKALRRWKEEENEARKRYFKDNLAGADRRAFMLSRKRRYEEYLKSQAEARTQLQRAQEEKARALKAQQLERAREFQDSLTRNEKPPARLWGDQSGAGG